MITSSSCPRGATADVHHGGGAKSRSPEHDPADSAAPGGWEKRCYQFPKPRVAGPIPAGGTLTRSFSFGSSTPSTDFARNAENRLRTV